MRKVTLWSPVAFALLWPLSLLGPPFPASANDAPNRIKIEYVTPQNPEQQPIYRLLKERHVLEKIQEVFSPFRLPIDLTVKTTTCGIVNAWYQRKDRNASVTICYELIDRFLKTAPKTITAVGITPIDTVVGSFFYVVAHEMGHAMFDLLNVPIFGGLENAADQFSAYVMLQFGKEEAYRLITGAAYSWKSFVDKKKLAMPLKSFSDVHGAPAQRFYNLVCMAYGADPKLFAVVVSKGFLPQQRAQDCHREYWEVSYAFKRLIRPHLDLALASRVLNTDWLPPESPRPLVPLPR